MARYRRYRKYTRSRRGKYSSNIQEFSNQIQNIDQGANFRTITLAFNPVQTNTATSQTYRVKNIEVNFLSELPVGKDAAENAAAYINDITAYIMFVPQGMNVTASYNLDHPEYIMAYKFIGSPSASGEWYRNMGGSSGTTVYDYYSAQGQNYQPHKVKTRLSRTLNTGDSIILFTKFNYSNSIASPTSFLIHGVARWWTKAN